MFKREKPILDLVNQLGKISINTLANELNVSVETIRRDLNKMHNKELIYRVHGYALSRKTADLGNSFVYRQNISSDAKKLIAQNIVEYVYEGAVIGLDASSSSWYLSKIIPNIPLTIVTNSMHNVNVLAGKDKIKTIATGGSFSAKYSAFYGPLAERNLANLHLNICFFSSVGIDENGDIWDSNEYNSSIKQKMIASASQVILLVDETKINCKSLVKICNVKDVDIISTNGDIPAKLKSACEKNNVLVFK